MEIHAGKTLQLPDHPARSTFCYPPWQSPPIFNCSQSGDRLGYVQATLRYRGFQLLAIPLSLGKRNTEKTTAVIKQRDNQFVSHQFFGTAMVYLRAVH